MLIDLHTHSTASDGTDSPAQLVAVAAEAGLDVIALTDHDTTAGWVEAAEALPPGLRVVPGAELSCVSDDGRGGRCSVHLLAYLFDPQADALVTEQRRLRLERRERLHAMAERMAADGFQLDADELLAGLPEDSPAGRPHLARALVSSGVVADVGEAFEHYLASGGPYYVRRADTPVDKAIEMIREAGGVTVIAHAFAHERGPTVTAEVIAELAEIGLDGIEVDHPNHDVATRAQLRELADSLNLLTTGSSDYHGTNKFIELGQETTDPRMFEAIVARGKGSAVIGR